MKLRISEAILRSEMNGKNVFKKDIAARIFPGLSEAAPPVNFTNLCQGKTKRVAPQWVLIICEMCDCTPNYLFNFNE
jgi:DNA-binding Xre family transcriptional regulator